MSEGVNAYPIYPETTKCECAHPGYCQRHRCDKPDSLHRLCQTKPQIFDLWERGLGPGQTRRNAQTACVHRGAQVDEVLCAGCQGHVRIKIFSCRVHDRCSLSQKLAIVACCISCADYESTPLTTP
jgi:hypothetical protein